MGVVAMSTSSHIDRALIPAPARNSTCTRLMTRWRAPMALWSPQVGQQQRCGQDVQLAGDCDESDARA
jgi:hypothetical protein